MPLSIFRLETNLPSLPGRLRRSRAAVLVVLVSGLFFTHCVSFPPPPVYPPLQRVSERTPVVFVPGILGTRLRYRGKGPFIWGRALNVFVPRDNGYAAALPITHPDDQPDAVESDEVIDEVRLAGLRRVVYQAIVDLLETNGYHRGRLDAPRPGDDLFLFGYDWRRSNTVSARLLLDKLEHLRQERGVDVLKVDLICQSNGAHLCRWLAKYGGASLEEASEGHAHPPRKIAIRRLILVGSSNGGSLRTLRVMNRGRSFVRFMGRRFQPEVLFTFRSLYQDLPYFAADLFLDEKGAPLDVDVYDPEAWRRYGWSIYGPETQERLARAKRADLFADEATRARFLARMLREARQFQELLHADVENFPDIRYYLVLNLYEPTSRRAVLVDAALDNAVPDNGGRGAAERGLTTWFTHDEELEEERPYLRALASAPGDGHGTWESQLFLSPQEIAAVAAEPFQIWGDHFAVILAPATQRRLLHLLYDGGEDGLEGELFHVPGPSSAVPEDEPKSEAP